MLLLLVLLAGLTLGQASAAPGPIRQAPQAEPTPITTSTAVAPSPPATQTGAISDTLALPANPFPEAPWQEETAREIAAALARGEELQVGQLPPITPLAEGHRMAAPGAQQPAADPAAGAYLWRAHLALVSKGGSVSDPDDDGRREADVAVSVWPNPSVYAVRNGTLAYEIRARNHGAGRADGVEVRLPYNRSLLQIYGSYIPDRQDWVSEVGSDYVTVRFGQLDNKEKRTVTLFFRVASWPGDGTTLPMQASFDWSDGSDGGRGKTNIAPVTVGQQEVRSAWSKLNVAPLSARVGTNHTFVSDRYLPGEGVSYWLNMPDGSVKGLDLSSTADGSGWTSVQFRTTGLPPGNYSLVGQGRRSDLVALGFFTVYL
jgi:hypothetical protein